MSLVKRKLFFAWQEEKEKAFLEEMALKGYKLSDYIINRYVFEEIEPTSINYQFDFNPLTGSGADEYFQMFEDSGWEHILTFGSWHYFCCEQGDNTPTDIFSNNESKMEKYRRLLLFLILTAIPMYLQSFIAIPVMLMEGPLEGFYKGFSFFLYPLVLVHIYALTSIFSYYMKLSKGIKE